MTTDGDTHDPGVEVGADGYVLIAEFDPARASMYRQVLAEAGLEAIAVRDGDAARTVLDSRGAPKLLVTDLSLPRTDGLTLVKHLRQIASPQEAPVLVLSAFASLRDLAIKAQENLGITLVAEKSVAPDEFRQLVARALGTAVARVQPAPTGVAGPQEMTEALIERFLEIARVPVVAISAQISGKRLVKAHVDVTVPLEAAPEVAAAGSLAQRAIAMRQPVVAAEPARGLASEVCLGLPETAISGRAAVPLLTTSGRAVGVATLLDVKPLELSQATMNALLQEGRAFADELELRHGAPAAPDPGAAGAAMAPHTDPLTGLYTRAAGEQAVVREAARVRRTGYPASLALLDIDGFTHLNDRHGREAGDRILRDIGRLLRTSFRQSDLSVRWGADEFLIVLSDVPLVGAALFAERVRAAVEGLSGGAPDRLTCSGAVVELGRHESPAAAIHRAELHLRAAKAAGGNRIAGAVLEDDGGQQDGPRIRKPVPSRFSVRD
jgi:diguanylate cyclase (GGDEF)-like protein